MGFVISVIPFSDATIRVVVLDDLLGGRRGQEWECGWWWEGWLSAPAPANDSTIGPQMLGLSGVLVVISCGVIQTVLGAAGPEPKVGLKLGLVFLVEWIVQRFIITLNAAPFFIIPNVIWMLVYDMRDGIIGIVESAILFDLVHGMNHWGFVIVIIIVVAELIGFEDGS